MTTFFSNLGQKPWFVPLLLIIMVLIALSSLLGPGESAAEEPEADMVASQLEALCNSVRGVKNAKVMITYESVPAASLVGFGSAASSGETRILGVAVLCDGGDDPAVQLKLYQLIQTLFQLPTTKITVSGSG